MNKRIITGVLVLLIGITSLFLSRNLIYNYVYGPHYSDFGNCLRRMHPPYYKSLMLKDEYISLSGRLAFPDNPVYDAPGSFSFYNFYRPGSEIIIKAADGIPVVFDTLSNNIYTGVLVDCYFKTPEELELKKILDRDYTANPGEYPYVYFDATVDVSGKKTFAWFLYVFSAVLIVCGFLLFFAGLFFGRKK